MGYYADRVAIAFRNIGFMLGFRPDYKLENTVATAAFAYTAVVTRLARVGPVALAVGALLLASPLIFQYNLYRRGYRRTLSLPLWVVIMSALAAAAAPILTPLAVVNALFVEDFTVFVSLDIVSIRRYARIMLEPVTRKELLVLIAANAATGVAGFFIINEPLSLVYPIIAYVMMVYSLIIVPPEYRVPERARSLLEELARRISILYFVFNRIYSSPRLKRMAREAGVFGYQYDVMIRRMGGVFAVSIYATLAAAPLLGPVLGPIGYALPAVIAPVILVGPYLVIYLKRSGRSSNIARNLLLILTYFASMKSVNENFTNIMLNLKNNYNLARLFGMYNEARLYHQIYTITGVESVAVREYADTIPNDFYRDTVRTMQDIEENEGSGAAFNMLIARIRDYTGRYVESISKTFENISSNIISVVLLVETALPILLFLTAPSLLPLIVIAGGVMSTVLIYAVSSATLPDLPSEYPNAKKRYRRAALLFSAVALTLLAAERILTPGLLKYELILNFIPAFSVAVWYASKEDLELNSMLLEKFSDMLVLFSSALTRYNAVDKAFMELSTQPTFPERLRREFARLARRFAYLDVTKLEYRGPYWYKITQFLASISAVYGVTPRALYKALGEFMLEFKRFVNMVKSYGRSLLFITLIGLLLMTVEVVIASGFLTTISKMRQGITSAGALGLSIPLPLLPPQKIHTITTTSYAALLLVAALNGLTLSKPITGTLRDGRYTLLFYITELLLIYAGATTHFGIPLK